MKLFVQKESKAGESRIAASPDSVKRLTALGFEVAIVSGAGLNSNFTDEDYKSAGAKILKTSEAPKALENADVLLAVSRPEKDSYAKMKKGSIAIGMFEPYANAAEFKIPAESGISTFTMEFVPRITRAQSMDVLSSQANLAGYRAVIDAAYELPKAFPMMMTAAGTVTATKLVVLGAGVAGLQAIATARRLGAIVSAFDVRAAAKEQVQSLGASFVEVPSEESGEGTGGYAKEMSDEYKKKQSQVLHDHLKKQDIAISTAQIPGKPAPILITEQMVKDMRQGAVIIDIAASSGGNCELTEPGKIVEKHGVKIVGHTNFPSRVARDASQLYARNLYNFIELLVDKPSKSLRINHEDEILKATLITHDGKVLLA